MLRKRLIGVITIRNGWAVQSFGYGRYLPLGRADILAKNLDRWGADEILLQCIDRSSANIGPDLELIERVARQGITTPLIYAGGIRNAEDGVTAVHAGADRVAVDAMLQDAPDEVARLEARLGAQAIIGVLPLSVERNGAVYRDYRSGKTSPVRDDVLRLLETRTVSEVVAVDWQNDGGRNFDTRLLDLFPVADIPLIAFGGLASADEVRGALMRPRVVAAAIGNSLNYREHTVRLLKQALGDLPIRSHSHQRWIDL